MNIEFEYRISNFEFSLKRVWLGGSRANTSSPWQWTDGSDWGWQKWDEWDDGSEPNDKLTQ